jgi:phosphate:Na+ symporter
VSPGTAVIVNLLGGIALLLWGVRMVRTGIMRAWGDRLERFITQHLNGRLPAYLSGAVATAILGSGTAMALIVAGIAASGAIGTSLGLAVLLGADLGSALVAAVFASGSSFAYWASPILIFIGFVTFSMSREFRPHNVGRIMIGLGLMLLSLSLVSTATDPLKFAGLFHEVLTSVGNEPILAFVIGAALAWLFHSTLAVILLVASFLANGSLELASALSFILGLNFGGGLPAVTATLPLAPEARRLPLANLFCRALLAVVLLALLNWLVPIVLALPAKPVEAAMIFHAGFNLLAGIMFLPFTGLVERLMKLMVRANENDQDTLAHPRYLDPKAVLTPSVALSNATLETVRMSELLDRMFQTALQALRANSLETLKQLKVLDERLNTYQVSIHTYLGDLAEADVSTESEDLRALEITLYVSNLEHAGDIIQLNLVDRIKAKSKESIAFTLDEQSSLDELCQIIENNLRLATGVLTSRDIEGAKRLIAQKDSFRALENKVLHEHFRRGVHGRRDSLRKSALYVDMIRDLHRINSHIVSVGYPIIDQAGLLRSSRIRKAASE